MTPVEIELIDPPARAFAGEPVSVGLRVRRPADRHGPAELRQIACREMIFDLDTDLFEQDVAVGPGEAYCCTVRVTFPRPGAVDLKNLYVDAWENGEYRPIVEAPARAVEVLPSLAGEVAIDLTAICHYGQGDKVAIELAHRGATCFDDFRVMAGPVGRVRAGVTEHFRHTFGPGETIRFDAVVAGGSLELTLDGQADGLRAGPVTVSVPVPKAVGRADAPRFRFLEPRGMASDDVVVLPADENDEGRRAEVRRSAGQFAITGGTRYRVRVLPKRTDIESVKLRGVPGQVEVGETTRTPDGGGWESTVFVALSPYLTTPVRLEYDAKTADGTLRGEVPLSVRPTRVKHFVLAAALGGAVTVKSLPAVVSAAFSPEGVWGDVPEILGRLWSAEALWLLLIPALFGLLQLGDRVYRRFHGE